MIYKFKLTAPTGETEIVDGDWPNQRDAAKYAVMSSVMWNVWVAQNQVPTAWDRSGIEYELLEPLALYFEKSKGGRPALSATDLTVKIEVTLPSSLRDKLDRIADGNRSAWIRQAIETA